MSAETNALSDLLARQDNVIARWQALELEVTRGAIAHRLKTGRWQVLLPGVYLAVSGHATEHQRVVAACLHAGRDAIVTGIAALRRHGLRSLPRTDAVHVLVPHASRTATRGYAVVQRTRHLPWRVLDNGVAYAVPERVLVDACLRIDDLRTVRALVAEAVQRRVCSAGAVAREVRRASTIGSRQIRRVLVEILAGVRSVAEAEFRALVLGSDLPEPKWNRDLYAPDGTWLGKPDAYWEEAGVAFQLDSREWHLLPEHWERTMASHELLSSYGVTVLHAPPRRIRTDGQGVIESLRRTLETGRERGPAKVIVGPAPQ